ncbi:MAG: DNA/RNA non-specific endonuclease [Chlamydiia bacterium]|nr:DNA/RNA non-specific endonuclease [Chlamydiia bacterium]
MGILKKSFGFSVGVAVGIASAVTYHNWDKELHPTSFPILERKGFTLAYDTRGKIPFWTHERLTAESLAKKADRQEVSFYEERDIYAPHRSRLKDYSKSGFDRGHLVPAGNQTFSKEGLKETFSLSNICPQHPQCNRGVWKKLEESIRRLVVQEGALEVVSGPLFLSHEENGKRYVTYQVIGENEVAVPTHFFKVVQTARQAWAYVIPNAPVSGELETFLFPLDQLEKISGIQLFSNPHVVHVVR